MHWVKGTYIMQAGKVLREIQALTANLYELYEMFHYTKAISLALPDIVAMGKDMNHTWSLKNYTSQWNLLKQRHYRTTKEMIKIYAALFCSFFFLTEQQFYLENQPED